MMRDRENREKKGEKLWNSKRKREKEQRMGWEPS
jgi:hypothetical protein